MSRGCLVVMWAIIGAIVGQLVGSAVHMQFPFFSQALRLGFSPTDLNFGFGVLTLGMSVNLSLGGMIGLVLALWLALRYV